MPATDDPTRAAAPTPHTRRGRIWAVPVLLVAAALVLVAVVAGALRSSGPSGPPELTVVATGATPAAVGDLASVYLRIDDAGGGDRLRSATSPASATVTLHDTTSTSDRGELMVDLSSLAVPAGGTLELVPGGRHLMLHHVFEALEPGDVVTVELTFERSGTMAVEVPVKSYLDLAELGR